MKQFAFGFVWFLFSIFVCYLPLSFAAWSFNPYEWAHWERFTFALFAFVGIGINYIKSILPKQIYKV